MAKDKCPECPKCLPGWLVQFGDLMSLLLTFFILLLSMAVMDKKKVEEYFDIMKKAMGFIDASTDVQTQSEKYSTMTSVSKDDSVDSTDEVMDEAIQEVNEVIKQMNDNNDEQEEQIQIEKGKNEFTLDIPSTIMFEEGKYQLVNPNAKRFIAKVARVIRTLPQTYDIEIIGHTSSSMYKSDTIPRDNWDLSALRSIEVVKELIKNKIDPSVLKVSAYASYHPKSELAADNRRVEMRFFTENEQSDILDEESFFDRLE
ncbi:OmpA/MotB family protein [Halarcobacter anaerophilus]|jgi:chemotaxis protein MotB|uniref:Flagellar motor protein MotB n=1 Tax=Halarcobacter anaerophilus TaxID=877500 RepID=A0A4Q0Y069_9BACT|nr:OmpA family protein [Halarcobacter anaerophilus]QDF29852.1 flagellar motor stator protein [Halarcobacter anaerophilus]RXJ62815.1 flagellar motor protein MotB [Halarcobacter anaerophilus]